MCIVLHLFLVVHAANNGEIGPTLQIWSIKIGFYGFNDDPEPQ